MEITASSFKLRANAPEGRKRFPIMPLLAATPAASAKPAAATVTPSGENTWTLGSDSLETRLDFKHGSLALTSLKNRAAGVDYLTTNAAAPLFVHTVEGARVAADDGKWKLEGVRTSDISLHGKTWGKRLEITLTRTEPVAFAVRQVFEIYNGEGGLRLLSFLRNGTDREITVAQSEPLNLALPDTPRTVHAVTGLSRWQATGESLIRGGRNGVVLYQTGHGVFLSPENNWATCLNPGGQQGVASEKMLYLNLFAGTPATASVTTNPKAIRLTLFPKEEIEWFAVNLGVFKGDLLDARMAAAEHLRCRFKFTGPMHQLATNDWQWGGANVARTDKHYREHVIPKAAAAGFDRVNIDDFWYWPEDSCTPRNNWTDMESLCAEIVRNGMKPGHWFSLQGKWCVNGWGQGRDAADPANIDFKLRQMRETLIGKYQTRWDQVDAGLLWKTAATTAYSHPEDSVYRKVLGMKRYMNTIAAEYPDFLMQVTCEIDNPSGAGGAASRGNQNVGLIHLAENGIVGMFRRTESGDDVRDLFDCFGMFPLEGLLSTWGEDRISASSWQDSPLWYYQFLLARHTMIYSRPWEWSPPSIQHMRAFNDWRHSPRVAALLNEPMRPVYNGADWGKNEGPWCWSFVSRDRSRMLLLAINHLDLAASNAFDAKLRWLDPGKSYLIEDITMQPGGGMKHRFIGEFSGAILRDKGLPVDLDEGPEPCAAFWIQERSGEGPQVLYADPAITDYQTAPGGPFTLKGTPSAQGRIVVYKPKTRGVENRLVTLNERNVA